jgi:dTDP-glucose pyrophosphorylase
MKAILLAGGKGTRLRPLTIHTPKPVVPIFDRAFLHYQIDLLKQVPEIDEVILSLNYQPRKIEEVFGDGTGTGVRIRYVVEPAPLGTGGAIRYAAQGIDDTLVVFNGDVMTSVDVNAVVALHRARQAKATIVLTPVDNPTAYGLVETESDGRVRRFLEKPNPDEITCDTINAGIYVLEPDTFDRIPKDVSYSIERAYFPSLIERKEMFVAYVDRGYWIDIGKVHPGPSRHVRRQVLRRHFRVGGSRPTDRVARRAHRGQRDDHRSVFHRRRRAREERRLDRRLHGARPRRHGRGIRGPAGHHRVAELAHRPERAGARTHHRTQLPHRARFGPQGPLAVRRQITAHGLHEHRT